MRMPNLLNLWILGRAIVGVALFHIVWQTFARIGKRLERLPADRSLILFWLNEIGSDIARFGRGAAWLTSGAVIAEEWLTVMPWYILGLESWGIVTLGLFAVSGLACIDTWGRNHLSPEIESRDRQFYTSTLSLSTNFGKYLVYGAGIVALLSRWGVNLGAIFTGGAIAALILGIGGQEILKDFFSGLFIVFERCFYEGSEICIGDVCGTVEKMTFRLTHIRSADGSVFLISNRTIEVVKVIRK